MEERNYYWEFKTSLIRLDDYKFSLILIGLKNNIINIKIFNLIP